MAWFKTYKFPLLSALTWLVVAGLFIANFQAMTIIPLAKQDLQFHKETSGTYGKFSYMMTLADRQNHLYSRAYKNYALSNLFLPSKNLEPAQTVYIALPKHQIIPTKNKPFYYASAHPLSPVGSAAQIISYMINNQIFFIIIPFIVLLICCSDEYKKDFVYSSERQRKLVNASYIAMGIFILLIAIY